MDILGKALAAVGVLTVVSVWLYVAGVLAGVVPA